MSKRGMNRKRLPPYTKMNSNQIEHLRPIARLAENLVSRFKPTLLLVMIHFLRVMPETDGLPDRNHYKSWLLTWSTQIVLATHNLKRVAETGASGPVLTGIKGEVRAWLQLLARKDQEGE
ncbi:hypothetical protein H4Q26_004626 [Puccinia striiformis f. sp. tritici PST-130]|nr:hypothetical protein H4Q26_004626 [Puccinia striiformis f. sp. tritici PST-130]